MQDFKVASCVSLLDCLQHECMTPESIKAELLKVCQEGDLTQNQYSLILSMLSSIALKYVCSCTMSREKIEKAKEWKDKHKSHVEKLLNDADTPITPSKEDEYKPELWKPGHWLWFVNINNKEFEIIPEEMKYPNGLSKKNKDNGR